MKTATPKKSHALSSLRKLLSLALAMGTPALVASGCGVEAQGLEQPAGAEEAIAPEQLGETFQALGTQIVPFDTTSWTFHRNNNAGYPRLLGNQAIFIPDDRYSASAVAFYRSALQPPYRVEFDYRTFDDDAGPSTNSADGFVLMLGKNPGAYGVPPAGGTRGFILDGTGYGVHLSTFGTRTISLTDGNGNVLASVPNNATYTAGLWKRVRVDVEPNAIRVYFDGAQQLSWSGTVNTQHGGVGLGAATGASDSEHSVRDVLITPMAKVPVSLLGGLPITIRGARINGGGNSLFDLTPGQQFSLQTDYTITQSSSCPNCIDQILIGYDTTGAKACIYDDIPSMSGTQGTATTQLTAPSTPGIHYLRFKGGQDYSCNLNWWSLGGPPPMANNFAVVSVKPDPNSCAHSTCTTGNKLSASCDPCTAAVCAADPYCCNNSWDSLCVSEVAQFCNAACN